MSDNELLEGPPGALPVWVVDQLRDFLELYRAAPEGRLRRLVFVKLCEFVEGLVRNTTVAERVGNPFPHRAAPPLAPPVVALYACPLPATEWPPEMATVVYSIGFPGPGPGVTTSGNTVRISTETGETYTAESQGPPYCVPDYGMMIPEDDGKDKR